MEGKGSITITIDVINAAYNVLSVGKERLRSRTWHESVSPDPTQCNHGLAQPAGMLSTGDGAVVEWILAKERATNLPAMWYYFSTGARR